MRVAFLVRRFPRLSETFVLDQVTGLLARGVEVDVWSEGLDSGVEVIEHPLLTYRDWPRTSLRAFGALTRLGVGGALRALRAAERLPFSRPRRYAARSGALRGSPEYDLVIAHFGPRGLEAQLYRDLGVLKGPLAVFFHGFDLSSFVETHGEEVYRDLLARIDWVLPISERWQTRLLGMGAAPERTRVHRMGVDLSHIPFAPRTWTPGSELKIVSVARLVEKKGLHVAIPAIAALARRRPGVRWDVIGGGPMLDELKALAAEHGTPVTFRGPQPRSEVTRMRDAAHLLLAPSVTARSGDQEGIPVAIMEAMAHGRMVVSTRHSGIPELVEDGVTGYLSAEGDSDALLQTLERACAESAAWSEQLVAARHRVEAEFARDVWDDRLYELVRASVPTS